MRADDRRQRILQCPHVAAAQRVRGGSSASHDVDQPRFDQAAHVMRDRRPADIQRLGQPAEGKLRDSGDRLEDGAARRIAQRLVELRCSHGQPLRDPGRFRHPHTTFVRVLRSSAGRTSTEGMRLMAAAGSGMSGAPADALTSTGRVLRHAGEVSDWRRGRAGGVLHASHRSPEFLTTHLAPPSPQPGAAHGVVEAAVLTGAPEAEALATSSSAVAAVADGTAGRGRAGRTLDGGAVDRADLITPPDTPDTSESSDHGRRAPRLKVTSVPLGQAAVAPPR
jgi:hypothetical protein